MSLPLYLFDYMVISINPKEGGCLSMKLDRERPFLLANFEHISITGFLIPCGLYAQKIGLFDVFEKHLKIDMKTVRYSPIDKVIELFVSIIAGCPDNKTINNRLVPDRLSASAWRQEQFADQSQIHILLHRVNKENLQQLEKAYQEIFADHSLAARYPKNKILTVDVDMTGLPVSPTSTTYEGAEFGHMEKKKSKSKGYQFSIAYIAQEIKEVLGGVLDSGNVHCSTRLPQLIQLTERRIGKPPIRRTSHMADRLKVLKENLQKIETRVKNQQCALYAARKSSRIGSLKRWISKNQSRIASLTAEIKEMETRYYSYLHDQHLNSGRLILIRADAGYGTAENVSYLFEAGYEFLVKGYSPKTSQKLARDIPEELWTKINAVTEVAEANTQYISNCPYPLRIIVGRKKIANKPIQYFHFLTTIPKTVMDARKALRYYNQRQSIEAFIKAGKIALHFRKLRVRVLPGIVFFLRIALLAYNFISWIKRDVFAGTELENVGIREFIEQVMRVPAKIDPSGDTKTTFFPEDNSYARALVDSTTRKNHQLSLFGD